MYISLQPKNIYLWCLLAFQAGAVNAGGFIACKRFVTHTTGFATLFGVDIAQKNYEQAFGMLTVPAFFLLGSMISSYFVDLPIQKLEAPNFKVPAALIFLSLAAAMIFSELGFFGVFGVESVIHQDYFFMVLLCLASGLQNAMIVNQSGVVMRTTHLTGLTTDLGMFLVRLIFIRDTISRVDRLAALARALIIISFILGSSVAAYLFFRAEYLGFILPVFTSLYILKYFLFRSK